MGEPFLAWAAADRAMSAAELSGDPLLAAASAWRLSYMITGRKHPQEALDLAMTAAAALEPFIAAPTCAFGVTAFHVIQDHPAYVPCGQRWPLRPELAALLGVCPLSQLTQGVGCIGSPACSLPGPAGCVADHALSRRSTIRLTL